MSCVVIPALFQAPAHAACRCRFPFLQDSAGRADETSITRADMRRFSYVAAYDGYEDLPLTQTHCFRGTISTMEATQPTPEWRRLSATIGLMLGVTDSEQKCETGTDASEHLRVI